MGGGTVNGFRALLSAELRIFLRDRAAMTFTFLFPLLFIAIFGALMGDVGTVSDARLGVAVEAGVDRTALDRVVGAIGSLEPRDYPSEEDLTAAVEARDVDFGVAWDGTSLTFVYDVRRTQENFAFEEVARGIASQFNLGNQGQSPLVTVRADSVGGQPDENWLSQVVPGILAFSILSAGLFAVAGHVTSMKQRKLLDRLVVTPMRPESLLGAIIGVRLVVVFISTLISLEVTILMFHVEFHVSWLRYVIFLIAATIGTMGMGSVIALLVRQPSSASNLANVFSMLMMFVSGIYFPIEIMPAFLRGVSLVMPLRYMADAMRYVTGVMDMSDARFWAICASLLVVGIGLLPFLSRYIVHADRR
jgi:ABC-2 type transport system permease protein